MLNNSQKKFRKEMEKIEKEKRKQGYDDIYSYRHDRFKSEYKRSIKKPIITIGGVLALIIGIYRLYAYYTWVHSYQGTISHTQPTYSLSTTSVSDPNHIQQAVHNYFQLSNKLENVINSNLNQVLTPNVQLSNQSYLDLESQIVALQDQLQTNLVFIKPLKDFDTNEIFIAKDIVEHIRIYTITHNPMDIKAAQKLIETYNTNIKNKKSQILIPILQAQHMVYTVDQNGALHYSYIPYTK